MFDADGLQKIEACRAHSSMWLSTQTGLRLRSGRTSIKMVDWDYDKKNELDEYDGPGKERGQVASSCTSMLPSGFLTLALLAQGAALMACAHD